MASLKDFLSQEAKDEAQVFGLPPGSTLLQVWCACMVIGGPYPGGYGMIIGGGSVYGRSGLSQEEFFVHQTLVSYVSGWMAGTDNAELEWFKEATTAELERVRILSETPVQPSP